MTLLSAGFMSKIMRIACPTCTCDIMCGNKFKQSWIYPNVKEYRQHTQTNVWLYDYLVCANAAYRVNKSCNGLENKPLRVHLQGVLMCSLDTVEHLILVTVHGGILQSKETHIKNASTPVSSYLFSLFPTKVTCQLPVHCTSSWQPQPWLLNTPASPSCTSR